MTMPATSRRSEATRLVTVAVCGNPNCGKTTLFNALTGLRQRVANYPGVTVEKTTGDLVISEFPQHKFSLVDIPGMYSLASFSPDEYVAAQALLGTIKGERPPDAIVCVVEATNLERSLYLVFQVMQIGRPVVLALNMMDLAEKEGMTIDDRRLSEVLGVPVVPIVANRGRGIKRLKGVIGEVALAGQGDAPKSTYAHEVIGIATRLREASDNGAASTAEYLRVLFDQNGPAEKLFMKGNDATRLDTLKRCRLEVIERFGSLTAGETTALTKRAAEVVRQTVTQTSASRQTVTERMDAILLHRMLGPIILVLMMGLMFQSIFSWAAPLMDAIDGLFGMLAGYVAGLMTEGPLQSLVVNGIIGGVGSVLIFLPQIVILFLFIALLEDSGYMPRAAFLVDRAFSWCGLSGKSFIPMLSSFACAVPGIMATRVIEDRRLRILTMMVAPLMSCSARLPVYTIMIAAFIPAGAVLGVFNLQGVVLATLYLLGILVAVAIAYVVKKTVGKTERGSFIMELPSYKVPTLKSVVMRVMNRAVAFVVRAGTVIFAITIIIWALSYYPRSSEISNEFAAKRAQVEQTVTATADRDAALSQLAHEEAGANLRNSYFGAAGRFVEPVFAPLGWDWRITMATLASFPAREVIIATLGTIHNLGSESGNEEKSLIEKMQAATWESGPKVGTPIYGPAVALSVMVFFALCCQCGATLVTIRQESGSWKYPIITFVYMTSMAYVGALVVYQVFSRMGW